jgi:hypothetical protein
MYLQSIKSVKHNAAMSVNRSILKKSRHIGIGLLQFNPSTVLSYVSGPEAGPRIRKGSGWPFSYGSGWNPRDLEGIPGIWRESPGSGGNPRDLEGIPGIWRESPASGGNPRHLEGIPGFIGHWKK